MTALTFKENELHNRLIVAEFNLEQVEEELRRLREENETLRARLAQPEPEPVAWIAYENGEKHGIDFDEDEIAELPVGTLLYPIPPYFLDPAKVARLMDEAFERGKKEIDMEQVKDIAQKLADCALLNSAPLQRERIFCGCGDQIMPDDGAECGTCVTARNAVKREWQELTDEEIKEIVGPWGSLPIDGYTRKLFDQIEAKLKEKNA